MKFLIDECCAKRLTQIAHAAGFEAYHVAELGLAGRQDYELKETILQRDFTFVTNNAGDFLRLFERMELHSGLIILKPNVSRAEQRELLNLALREIEKQQLGDLTNKVIEADFDGVIIYELPKQK